MSPRSTRVRCVRIEPGQGRAGRERQRGIKDDEEGGHPTSTQILICWSAELCGIAVQIG